LVLLFVSTVGGYQSPIWASTSESVVGVVAAAVLIDAWTSGSCCEAAGVADERSVGSAVSVLHICGYWWPVDGHRFVIKELRGPASEYERIPALPVGCTDYVDVAAGP